ncbi:hypothetical protein DIS24_g6367 [Lasiodiplodia hormozganensis]|uniref:DUF2786 domain-containing protein n=1 Tax=Lasiodiplodia hormozganensis TaxID=869390 RepID=A0AA39YEN1_9PEZI|nr:hypothetical protein DIS24_g6367 [Lasiodiplodia hormozganensis]
MAYPFLLDIPIPGRKQDEEKVPSVLYDGRASSTNGDPYQGSLGRTLNAQQTRSSAAAGNHEPTPGFMDQDTSNEPLACMENLDNLISSEGSTHGMTTKSRIKHGEKNLIIDLTKPDDESEDGAKSAPTVSSNPSSLSPGCASPTIRIKPEGTPDPEAPPQSISEPQTIKLEPEEPGTEGSHFGSDTSTSRGTKRPANQTSEGDSEEKKQQPPRKRGRPAKEPPPPIYIATAKRASGTSDIPGALEIDDSVLSKIKKCFERAEHENASEAEARAAMFLAGKLMRQYNVEKAEVMQHKTPEEQAQCAGSSEVTIERRDGTKVPIPIRQWVSDLTRAISKFFDVKRYSSTPKDRFLVRWVFYGIAQNTASAALAFEKIYNLVIDWARFKKGIAVTNSYCLGIADQLYRDAKKEKKEEMKKAKKAEAEELAAREKEEQLQREKELERLQPTVEDESDPEPVENNNSEGPFDSEMDDTGLEVNLDAWSDPESADPESGEPMTIDTTTPQNNDKEDENESDDDEPDFVHDDDENTDQNLRDTDKVIEELVQHMNKRNSISPLRASRQPSPQPASPSSKPTTLSTRESPEPEPQWKSAMQLMLFRDTAAKIADDFLKANNKKLKNRRKGAKPKDAKAFREGRKDAKKIDVRQKALEDKNQEIKEEDDG